MELLFKIVRHWLNGFFRPARNRCGFFVFRPAYVGHQDRPSTPLYDMEECSDSPVDAIGIPYGAVLHYIMIETDKDYFPLQVRFLDKRGRS